MQTNKSTDVKTRQIQMSHLPFVLPKIEYLDYWIIDFFYTHENLFSSLPWILQSHHSSFLDLLEYHRSRIQLR